MGYKVLGEEVEFFSFFFSFFFFFIYLNNCKPQTEGTKMSLSCVFKTEFNFFSFFFFFFCTINRCL